MKQGVIKDEYATRYYVDDKLHRVDGPAAEYTNGSKGWWINGQLHRQDGPAIENADGSKSWFINGYLHREDGPAVEDVDGYKEWWVNDEQINCSSQEEFEKIMKLRLFW